MTDNKILLMRAHGTVWHAQADNLLSLIRLPAPAEAAAPIMTVDELAVIQRLQLRASAGACEQDTARASSRALHNILICAGAWITHLDGSPASPQERRALAAGDVMEYFGRVFVRARNALEARQLVPAARRLAHDPLSDLTARQAASARPSATPGCTDIVPLAELIDVPLAEREALTQELDATQQELAEARRALAAAQDEINQRGAREESTRLALRGAREEGALVLSAKESYKFLSDNQAQELELIRAELEGFKIQNARLEARKVDDSLDDENRRLAVELVDMRAELQSMTHLRDTYQSKCIIQVEKLRAVNELLQEAKSGAPEGVGHVLTREEIHDEYHTIIDASGVVAEKLSAQVAEKNKIIQDEREKIRLQADQLEELRRKYVSLNNDANRYGDENAVLKHQIAQLRETASAPTEEQAPRVVRVNIESRQDWHDLLSPAVEALGLSNHRDVTEQVSSAYTTAAITLQQVMAEQAVAQISSQGAWRRSTIPKQLRVVESALNAWREDPDGYEWQDRAQELLHAAAVLAWHYERQNKAER